MKVKMIVTDLDGTLLRSDKTISDYTIEVLNRCRQKGIKIVLATARSLHSAANYVELVKPDVFIISGGSLAFCGERQIYNELLTDDVTNSIIREVKAGIKYERICVHSANWLKYDTEKKYWQEDRILTDFSKPIEFGDSILMYVRTKYRTELGSLVGKYPELSVIGFTGEDTYQIKNKNASKENALKSVAVHLRIELADAVAFGDDYNDIEMLRECGVGIAVANALDEAKIVADYICDFNDNDGVAKWLEENVL